MFNPYSGVKTSILILDKVLAAKTNCVAFFKVENDGFDLGAQRRPIGKDDLPAVTDEIGEYLGRLRLGESLEDFHPRTGLVVEKVRVAVDGDYVFNGERYRTIVPVAAKWPLVSLKDCCHAILSGGTPSTEREDYWTGDIPWITSADIVDIKTAVPRKFITQKAIEESATNLIKQGNIIVVTRVGLGKIFKNEFDVCISQDSQGLIIKENIDVSYLVWVLQDQVQKFKNSSQGSTIQGVTKKQLSELQIPLPPLEVQHELVAEIESYQRVLDGARAVVENWRPRIMVDPEWPVVTIGDCCTVRGGKRLPKGEQLSTQSTSHPYIRVSDFKDQTVDLTNLRFVPEKLYERIARYTISSSDVYISIAGTIGMMGTIPESLDGANLTENAARLSFDHSLLDKHFLVAIGNSETIQSQMRSLTHAVGVPKLALERIKTIRFPLPSIDTQRAIVAENQAEQALVSPNRELVERMEQRIQDAITRVWEG